jgi:hypothetical protein
MALLISSGRRRLAALAVAAVGALAAGCYQPSLRDCTVSCTGADDCAGDQICGPDGYCALPEAAGSCGDGGAGADAPVDADMADADPSAPDADVSEPDANLPDASPPDAAGPLVTLKVRVVGIGRVVSDAWDISCDGNCDYHLPMGSVVTVSPVVTDQNWSFTGWTSNACAGQTPDCTLTLGQPQQTARAQFDPQ